MSEKQEINKDEVEANWKKEIENIANINKKMTEHDKLFIVKTYMPTSSRLGSAYVVAKDSNEAYLKVRKYLDEKDYGFYQDRCLDSVTLVADSYEHAIKPTMLFL